MPLIELEPPFCETGCLLAVQFQCTAAAAVEKVSTEPSMTLRLAVMEALRKFIEHVQNCQKCEAQAMPVTAF